ncbi:MAG: hypothetical protein JST04_01520 [Bdellovibrionales bacterium]|nr:hypothetical protein [Bdellovibrionales bacterium]
MAKTAKIAPVFLSAGIPDPKRNPKYISTADILAIREAVTALTLAVVPRGKLVFGGHPAISPLVYLAAKSVGGQNNVTIFQSNYFRGQVPEESRGFDRLIWTRKSGGREESLALMRRKMIASENFGFGIFIGGMEGIEEEWEMFEKRHPNGLAYPIASTGAASKILLRQKIKRSETVLRQQLLGEFVYGTLFRKLLGIV